MANEDKTEKLFYTTGINCSVEFARDQFDTTRLRFGKTGGNIAYLRSVGFDVTNDIFARHSWYFRNALVRANYNNYPAGVSETTEYLELFLRNLLLNEDYELKNRYLHIRWNDVKQDIEETKQHILSLFREYGYKKFFGRSEVMQLLGITASPASALIKRMVDSEIIYPIKGKGKGKYLFR